MFSKAEGHPAWRGDPLFLRKFVTEPNAIAVISVAVEDIVAGASPLRGYGICVSMEIC